METLPERKGGEKDWRLFTPTKVAEFEEFLEEVNALIYYASEKGIDPELEIRGPLIEAIEEIEVSDKKPDILKNIHKHYTQLSLLTGGITGRSLLSTKDIYFHLSVLISLTFTLLIAAIGSELLDLWFVDRIELEEGVETNLRSIHRYILSPLTPLFWGGLGSCIYLLKRLTDFAAERQFDKTKFQGWQIRVWLGAILGLVAQFIFDPNLMGNYGLTQNALAFLIGLGVKVFYGAIEKLIQVTAEKINLKTIKPRQEEYKDIEQFLRAQLNKIKKDEQPEKHDFLSDLISELRRQYQT